MERWDRHYARILRTGFPVPYAEVDVFLAGTLTRPPAIYSNNLASPTLKTNPFTSDEYGYIYFYAPDGRYDVRVSHHLLIPSPYTWGDQLLFDGRQRLTANLTVYVATTGSDASGDGTIANPWATPIYAYSTVAGRYDLNGKSVVIQIADGEYTSSNQVYGNSLPGQVGPGAITFRGNLTDGTQVVIRPTPDTGYCFSAAFGAQFALEGMKFEMPVDEGGFPYDQLSIGQNAQVLIGDEIHFGMQINPGNHVNIAFGGYMSLQPPSYQYHVESPSITGRTISFSNGATSGTVSDATDLLPYMGVVTGAGLPEGTYIDSIVGSTLNFGFANRTTFATTSAQANIPVQFDYGGQCHILAGDRASVYANTNGEPNRYYTVRVTVGYPFFYAGVLYALSLSSFNYQAVNWTNGAGNVVGAGRAPTVRGNSILDTNLVGIPYLPSSMWIERASTFVAGDTVLTIAGGVTGITTEMTVNGVARTTATFGAGVLVIAVAELAFVEVNNTIRCLGIQDGTKVAAKSGASGPGTVTLDFATISAQTNTPIIFKGSGVANGSRVVAVNGGANQVTISPPAATGHTAISLHFDGLIQSGGQYI